MVNLREEGSAGKGVKRTVMCAGTRRLILRKGTKEGREGVQQRWKEELGLSMRGRLKRREGRSVERDESNK